MVAIYIQVDPRQYSSVVFIGGVDFFGDCFRFKKRGIDFFIISRSDPFAEYLLCYRPYASFFHSAEDRTVPMCAGAQILIRSEEHTSELQSRGHLVCSLLLEKKNIGIVV